VIDRLGNAQKLLGIVRLDHVQEAAQALPIDIIVDPARHQNLNESLPEAEILTRR
jgi:hypothetical protein